MFWEFEEGLIHDIVLVLTVAGRHARMAVSRPPCSPERIRPAGFSAAPALFLIVGTGTAAGRSLKWRGLHGGPPAWRRCGGFSDRGNAGLVYVIGSFLARIATVVNGKPTVSA
jgi:hypothetical protein